jgi:PIN domain nuclease of toxin-antitoxin system
VGGGPLTLLLDTHVLLWWISDGGRLSRAQSAALDRAAAAGAPLGVASITLWEIAKLAERRRIRVTQTIDAMLEQLEEHPSIEVLPLTARIAVESTRLGVRMCTDPADQLIVATARVHGLRLVTADGRIRESGVVSVV